jgi:hypothetical protein
MAKRAQRCGEHAGSNAFLMERERKRVTAAVVNRTLASREHRTGSTHVVAHYQWAAPAGIGKDEVDLVPVLPRMIDRCARQRVGHFTIESRYGSLHERPHEVGLPLQLLVVRQVLPRTAAAAVRRAEMDTSRHLLDTVSKENVKRKRKITTH